MDTPQLTPALLARVIGGLAHADAILGPAQDGGWWSLLLRDPSLASVLPAVPMSTDETGLWTAAALRRAGARVLLGDILRDVDTAKDAAEVAIRAPGSRFARAVAEADLGAAAVAR